jgi:hypothetical protein
MVRERRQRIKVVCIVNLNVTASRSPQAVLRIEFSSLVAGGRLSPNWDVGFGIGDGTNTE